VTKALLDVRYALTATRDIEIGEEFTNDYAAEVVDPPFYDILYEHYGVSEGYLDVCLWLCVTSIAGPNGAAQLYER
jgi:hypothetical protein